jgi:hypothetical protein
VFDIAKVNEARIEYWLRQINSVAACRPPIILLGTHRDRCHESRVVAMLQDLETRFRQQWCGNVRSIQCISAMSRQNLVECRRLIVETAQSMLSSSQVPAYYLSLRHLLLSMRHENTECDYVRLADLERRFVECVPFLASRPSDLQQALSFFHHTGTILFFADMPQLRDLVIMDPRWLARVLAT